MDMEHLNDRLPSMICCSCFQQLNQWYKFRETCHFSQNILLEYINKILKNDYSSCIKKENTYVCNNDLSENNSSNLKLEMYNTTDSLDSDRLNLILDSDDTKKIKYDGEKQVGHIRKKKIKNKFKKNLLDEKTEYISNKENVLQNLKEDKCVNKFICNFKQLLADAKQNNKVSFLF